MNGNSEITEGTFTSFVDPSFKTRSWSVPSSPKHGIFQDSPQLDEILNTNDAKKIKTLLRQNHWPPQHEIRKGLWPKICKVKQKDSSSFYHDTVTDMFGTEQHVNASLPNFVDPSTMYQYHLSDHGVNVAKKVMCIVGKSRPDVVYAPTLYTISCLMLHYVEEQEVFDIVERLLNSKAKHILQTKVAYQASAFVLKELLKKYVKKLYGYILLQKVKPEHVLSDWLWWIFRDLPFSHLVCVMDCYLFEGPKVLYRVALAILKLFYDHKIKSADTKLECDLNIAVSQFCQDMPEISVDHLLKVAFKIRGFSRKEIQKLVIKQEMYVTSLINTQGLQATLTKSPSCESLNDKVTVSRSFSLQEIGSSLLSAENESDLKLARMKSLSHGTVYVPFSNTKSSLLTQTHWSTLWGWIPDRVRLLTPELIFSTSEHGTSLTTFYNHVDNRESCPATLLIIKTTSNKIIGAYCSEDWAKRVQNQKKLSYFGTGETFVFTLEPSQCRYQWVGINLRENTPTTAHLFMSGDNQQINIGGGCDIAIRLDEDLNHGESRRCDTFDNPPLTGGEYFDCATVEVFGFS